MEELVIEVKVNMSVELQSSAVFVVPVGLYLLKLLAIESVPHVDATVQLMMIPPLLVHWYMVTSLEQSAPGPTSCVD